MKQNISTLMDGELCGDEAELLLAKIKNHPEAKKEWLTYHLIGDVLRQPDYISGNLKAGFLERLYAEPTVLAPQDKRVTKTGFYAMSVMASVMALVFLSWLSVQLDDESVLQQHPAALSAASFPLHTGLPINDSMNDYLLAHYEFSPASDMRGVASYIRTVADTQSAVGK